MSTNSQTYSQLLVDLTIGCGPIKHGASGFLYGLGNAGIPSANVLAPLKPRVAAQKPEGGLQHPNGDALNVASTYWDAGGKEIEIYLQDIYSSWPYENLGIDDYCQKVTAIVEQVAAGPKGGLFSYVPINEPDQIWYNLDDKKQAFFDDWQKLYQTIMAIDPAARIVGPNLARYESGFYREFLTFALHNNCLPKVISWHELNADFYTDWYAHYDDYRAIEASLGIPAREICINEYAQISRELGVPGKLVQWLVRFENSKVDACLAYWTSAGCLNDLVTRDNYNQATGAWWLYKWYGDMTGQTVSVTPPEVNAEGLQGLAVLDRDKKQARIVFGGCSGETDLVVSGLNAIPEFKGRVHATVWETDASGYAQSAEPAFIMESGCIITDGQITVTVNDMRATAAYLMVLTPDTVPFMPQSVHRYEAEYADLSGAALIRYGGQTGYSGTGFVEGHGPDASVLFVLSVPANGYYTVRLRYSSGLPESVLTNRSLHLELNGAALTDIPVPVTFDWNTWAQVSRDVFLTAGINRLEVTGLSNAGHPAVNLDYLEIAPSTQKMVAYVPEMEGGALWCDNVCVSSEGIYRMVVRFANAESRGAHSYNSQIVDVYVKFSINGTDSQGIYLRNTFSWDNYQTSVVDVNLQAGENSIRFFPLDGNSLRIDQIQIAAPFRSEK
jgi:hypothetical protein